VKGPIIRSTDPSWSGPRGGCLVVFGLPFLAVGLGVMTYAWACWKTYLESADWAEVPATVKDVQFETNSGNDGTTYSVACSYSYEFKGRMHHGTRVGIMGGSSSSYKLHRRRYEILKEHMDAGKPYQALVDPDDPTRSLLFREDMDTWMYVLFPFGLVFAGAGAGCMGAGVYQRRKRARREELKRELGERPWLFREDWRDFRVRALTWMQISVLWTASIGGAVFLSVFHIFLLSEEGAPLFAKIIVWALTAAAGLALLNAVLVTIRQFVHGTPELVLNELPVVPGRKLVAVMRTTRRPIDASRVAFRLVCRKRVTTRSGGETTTTYEDIYKKELEVDAGSLVADGEGTLVPVVAEIPASLPGTGEDEESFGPGGRGEERDSKPVGRVRRRFLSRDHRSDAPTYDWKLEVVARTFPVALKAAFDLPVFEADESEIRKRQDTVVG
jgi:hypothetical protein